MNDILFIYKTFMMGSRDRDRESSGFSEQVAIRPLWNGKAEEIGVDSAFVYEHGADNWMD
jgi:hypothetical protein